MFKINTLIFSAFSFIVSSIFSMTFAVIDPATVLTAGDGATDDQFGWSVAMDGNTAVVGAYLDDEGDQDSGSVYIYENDGAGNWAFKQKLTAQRYEPDDTNLPADADTNPDLVVDYQRDAWFGYSVAIHGDLLVVGTPFFDKDGGEDDEAKDLLDSGAVYIYKKSGGVWGLNTRFTIEDDGAKNGDWFGNSVAVYDDTVAVGTLLQSAGGSGGVHILHRDTDGKWNQQFAQTANAALALEEQKTLLPLNAQKEDWFGRSVAINKRTIVVGSDGSDGDLSSSGSAYVFTRDANHNWNLQAKLQPSDKKLFSNFGISVSIDSNTLIVGADGADGSATDDSKGAAYIFSRDFDGRGREVKKATASDGAAGDKFGRSVVIK
ncbi:MAG: FG-GAP repeat protein, partial [Gammaproteobacteria bacterium]|nr:FG-GAP repeat protein [Gammaproteobacteria bacterium]